MDDGAGQPNPRPITPELLADLQAGLLDDATAAALRQRIRTDPTPHDMLAALDRVRRDLADLGADDASAADVPGRGDGAGGRRAAGRSRRVGHPGGHRAHSVRHTPRWQLVGSWPVSGPRSSASSSAR